jgi:hypothetical protein
MEAEFYPKHRLICSGLHGNVSHKIELFLASDARESEPACWFNVCKVSEENMDLEVKYNRTILFAAFLGHTLSVYANVWFDALL